MYWDELYFVLFKFSEGVIWSGNLKCYCLDGDEVLDKNGLDVVDSVMGFFVENLYSYWLVFVDGNDVREGGVVSKMMVNCYFYVFNVNGVIMSLSNVFYEDNSSIIVEDLGIEDEIDV